MEKSDKVFGIGYSNLGDMWAQVNYLLGKYDNPKLSTSYRWPTGSPKILAEKIGSFLDTSNKLRMVDEPMEEMLQLTPCQSCQYLPTKIKWTGAGSGKVCVQFDGRSESELKNLEPEVLDHLLQWLGERHQVINVGGWKPLDEVLEEMAGAEAFVGIPSGMSHIANSIGVPNVVILTEKLLSHYGDFGRYVNEIYYNKPNMVFYRGAEALMSHPSFVANFVQNLRQLVG